MAIWFGFFFLEEGMSLLKPDMTLFVVIGVFLLLVFLLNTLIFKPVLNVVNERERLTTGAMAQAKHSMHDYEKRLSTYEEKIGQARAESYKMLEAERNVALGKRSQILAGVKSETM